MIKDVSGIELIPGNMGKNCPGNGNYFNDLGEIIICCDECDYLICCSDANNKKIAGGVMIQIVLIRA